VFGRMPVIQAPKLGLRIMRYELADFEWAALKPMLPNKPRGVPRVNDRRVLNGIFWVLRSGAPWRDLPEAFGPYTTCYNRFVRWRRAGVWSRIMNALAAAHDTAVQMIDTSIVRVHQHGACITRNQRQSMGRSRGGLTSKIHALVDSNGLPVRLALSPGEAHDNRLAGKLQHSGAIVKTIGDAVMAVFSRPTDAVSAALDILGEDRAVQFRAWRSEHHPEDRCTLRPVDRCNPQRKSGLFRSDRKCCRAGAVTGRGRRNLHLGSTLFGTGSRPRS
jgi:transposase